MNIFLNDTQELRSGWKFAVYVALFLIIWVASGLVISMVYARSNLPESQLTFLWLNEVALLVPAIAAMLLSVRFVDRRPLKVFGVGFLPHWQRDLGSGLALASLMLTTLVAGCYAFGYVSIHWTGTQAPGSTLLATFGLILIAAVSEELVFRGFPLQILVEGMGQWPAVITMSLIFGAMHLNNPNASLLGWVNTVLAGVLLSIAYIRARSLWLPYGIHVGWNIGIASFWDSRCRVWTWPLYGRPESQAARPSWAAVTVPRAGCLRHSSLPRPHSLYSGECTVGAGLSRCE